MKGKGFVQMRNNLRAVVGLLQMPRKPPSKVRLHRRENSTKQIEKYYYD